VTLTHFSIASSSPAAALSNCAAMPRSRQAAYFISGTSVKMSNNPAIDTPGSLDLPVACGLYCRYVGVSIATRIDLPAT
jgi:hypothetical protein